MKASRLPLRRWFEATIRAPQVRRQPGEGSEASDEEGDQLVRSREATCTRIYSPNGTNGSFFSFLNSLSFGVSSTSKLTTGCGGSSSSFLGNCTCEAMMRSEKQVDGSELRMWTSGRPSAGLKA